MLVEYFATNDEVHVFAGLTLWDEVDVLADGILGAEVDVSAGGILVDEVDVLAGGILGDEVHVLAGKPFGTKRTSLVRAKKFNVKRGLRTTPVGKKDSI